MGKCKHQERAKLPLFDLPLNSDAAEADSGGPALLDDFAEQTLDLEPAQPPSAQPHSAEPPLPAASPPVQQSEAPAPTAVDAQPAPASASQLDLMDLATMDAAESKSVDESDSTASSIENTEDKAQLGDRVLAGIADLAVQLLMQGLAVAASHALCVVVTLADWMPFALLALSFSFLYWVVPLAFWGQTPGMAWVGHTARASSEQPLSFGQTFLRWIGAILTLAFAGLPLLLVLKGRSLSDRLSDSKTLIR